MKELSKSPPDKKRVFLTVAEAARRLGIGVERVYKLIWSGKIPAQRASGQRYSRYMIPVEVIEQRIKDLAPLPIKEDQ